MKGEFCRLKTPNGALLTGGSGWTLTMGRHWRGEDKQGVHFMEQLSWRPSRKQAPACSGQGW